MYYKHALIIEGGAIIDFSDYSSTGCPGCSGGQAK